MLPLLAQAVGRWRRRAVVAAWVEHAVVHVACAWFAAGCAVLVCRVALGWERTSSAAWLALGAIACVSAWLVARRGVPSARVLAAQIDVASGASGLVVTENELGASEWSDVARQRIDAALAALPKIRRPRASWMPLVALAFAVAALWVAPPQEELGPPPAVADAALERVEEQLAALEETLELEPELAAELEQRLERIEAEAENGSPESTFEALDNLSERLEEEASDALESAQRTNEGLSSAATDPALDEAQDALERALETMRGAGLEKGLSEELVAKLEAGTLTLPEGMQLDAAELAKLAQGLRGQLDERLAKLARAGLLTQQQLGRLGELGTLDDFDPSHVCDEDCKKPGGT